MKDYIKIQDLVIDYGESLAVNKINIDIEKGSLVTLLGPSGCGKSTTLNALAGLITPTSGKILFNGKNVTRTSPSNRGIGLVFQSYALYPHMSVYDNIAFSLRSSKEFRKEINEFNDEISYQIFELKWLSIGLDKDEFNSHLENIKEFKRLLKEREEKMNYANGAYNAKVGAAKELIPNEKLKMDGKIKAASDSILKKLDSWENEIKQLRVKDRIAQKKLDNKEQKDLLKQELENRIKEISDLKIEAMSKYESDIKRYKEDFKSNSINLKELRIQKINEANSFRSNIFQEIKEELTSKIGKLRQPYAKGLNIIKSKTKAYKKGKDLSIDDKIEVLTKQLKNVTTEIDLRVKEVADKVGITKNLEKMVTNLSGGQQQRVAISRTLVKNPDILLLDEPLSNLDAKMRISTREWIRELQQDLGITTIFVTHDQEEAMSISDEIVCMSVGHVQQKAAPMDMYHQPANKFVAGFLGMPMMNFFNEGKIAKEISKITKLKLEDYTFGCRPEHIKLASDLKKNESALLTLKAEVIISEAFGREVLVTAKVGEENVRFFVDNENLKRGDKVEIVFRKTKVYAFERKDNEKTVGRF